MGVHRLECLVCSIRTVSGHGVFLRGELHPEFCEAMDRAFNEIRIKKKNPPAVWGIFLLCGIMENYFALGRDSVYSGCSLFFNFLPL